MKTSKSYNSCDKRSRCHSNLNINNSMFLKDTDDSLLKHPYNCISDRQKKIIQKCREELRENVKLKFDILSAKKKGKILFKDLSMNSDLALKQLVFERMAQRYSNKSYFPSSKLI